MLENINFKIEGLSSSVKNQLSFNKMIETKLAQTVATIPIVTPPESKRLRSTLHTERTTPTTTIPLTLSP